MATLLSNCPECYPISVPSCVDLYHVAGFTPADEFYVIGTDRFGNTLDLNPTTRAVTESGYLNFSIPDGYDSPNGQGLTIRIYSSTDFVTNGALCDPETLTICAESYTCIKLSFHNNVMGQTDAHVICYCEGDITPPVEPPVELPFIIGFNDIANAALYVADINAVDDWNGFIGASTGFTSVVINGNNVELYGGGEKALLNTFLNADTFIGFIDDQSLTIVEIPAYFATNAATSLTYVYLDAITFIPDAAFLFTTMAYCSFNAATVIHDQAFALCVNMVNYSFPLATQIKDGQTFKDNTLLASIYAPLLTEMGITVGDDSVFVGIAGNNITLTVGAVLATCNAGNPDGDITTLSASNTVTMIYI